MSGSPAPAGIDPRGVADDAHVQGLPRTRGDRPRSNNSGAVMPPAPPHPRGSTPHVGAREDRVAGSPAPAGIDPISGRISRTCTWLPRTRGDRPLRQYQDREQSEAPPHPRGSTRQSFTPFTLFRGSPAPAGIDPCAWSSVFLLRWLPRTRGDRPLSQFLRHPPGQAPPHPRGSTPHDLPPDPRLRGSPAPAGIDPAPTSSPRSATRLPRTRGDRPLSGYYGHPSVAAPPHPRGSTLRAGEWRPRARGSPAPAGIDPPTCGRTASRRRLPRTRGDRPPSPVTITGGGLAPPHPRGSTQEADRHDDEGDGSPAPAGIDPRPARGYAGGNRLPRTRGDRPEPRGYGWDANPAPPHPRGSTLDGHVAESRIVGSPAPAGIDPCPCQRAIAT